MLWTTDVATTVSAALLCAFVVPYALHLRRAAVQRRELAERAARKRRERDAARARAAKVGLDWAGLLRWIDTQPKSRPSPQSVVQMSARQLLDAMNSGTLTSEHVTRCFVARAMQVGEALGCNAEEPFEAAIAEAILRDEERRAGKLRGPLHGLPISIKDQANMKGCDSTCGLACRTFEPKESDGVLVAVARAAGAIPFVRTNVPQLLMLPETFNAIWGTASNPYDLARTPGGSSGGEGALIGARGSPLGLGTDVGGSIRIPATMCGISGFKPTTDRLSYKGIESPRVQRGSGQKEVRSCPGPMGRSVDDLELLMSVWCTPATYDADPTLPRMPWDHAAYLAASPALSSSSSAQGQGGSLFRGFSVGGGGGGGDGGGGGSGSGSVGRKMRFGVMRHDGWCEPAAACSRALDETVAAVRAAGHEVVELSSELVGGAAAPCSYISIVGADGNFRCFIEGLEGEALHPVYSFLRTVSMIPNWARPLLGRVLVALGQPRKAALVQAGCGKSAYDYWLAIVGKDRLRKRLLEGFREHRIDALLCPALGLPALPHTMSRQLAPLACSYTFLWNNLDCPAGTLPVTTVREAEQAYRGGTFPGQDADRFFDSLCVLANQATAGSAGLPVSVQVVGLPWRDEATLGAMREVERCLAAAGRGAAKMAMPPHPPLHPEKATKAAA